MSFNLRYVDYPASPDRPFPCDFCPLSFDRQHDLKRHIDTHSGEKPFLCDRGCGKAFTRKDALKRHQTSFPFCPPVRPPSLTDPTTTANSPAQMHPRSAGASPPIYSPGFPPSSKHGNGTGLPSPLPYGSRFSPSSPYTPTFPSSSNYPPGPSSASQYGGRFDNHGFGPSSPGSYGMGGPSSQYGPGISPPPNYSASFVPPPQYAGDYPASPPRPYPCDACPLSFDRHHDLKRHRATHAGDRPYVCNGGCDKTFTRKDALKRHQLSKECGRVEP